ncbi:MAG: hypothetical protein ACRDHL_09325 [Candidatus Promineifilaceae bacterium]
MPGSRPPALVPRVLLALIAPAAAAILFPLLTGRQGQPAVQLAGAGLAAWYLGWRWYGLPGLGLRGRRPLYAGIGFASLTWLAFLILRFAAVPIIAFGAADGFQTFVYLLLFEAFCAQLWAYGLFFRAAADASGGLTAAVAAGLLFGAVGFILFRESFVTTPAALLFFAAWGVLYGVIRLRTGSLVGLTLVQALQSWTAWQLMQPPPQPAPGNLTNLYLLATAVYAVLVWRLWPRREDDYRV